MFPDLFVRVNANSCIREDENGLPVCVAEGPDGTAELQEIISKYLFIIDNANGSFFL